MGERVEINGFPKQGADHIFGQVGIRELACECCDDDDRQIPIRGFCRPRQLTAVLSWHIVVGHKEGPQARIFFNGFESLIGVQADADLSPEALQKGGNRFSDLCIIIQQLHQLPVEPHGTDVLFADPGERVI